MTQEELAPPELKAAEIEGWLLSSLFCLLCANNKRFLVARRQGMWGSLRNDLVEKKIHERIQSGDKHEAIRGAMNELVPAHLAERAKQEADTARKTAKVKKSVDRAEEPKEEPKERGRKRKEVSEEREAEEPKKRGKAKEQVSEEPESEAARESSEESDSRTGRRMSTRSKAKVEEKEKEPPAKRTRGAGSNKPKPSSPVKPEKKQKESAGKQVTTSKRGAGEGRVDEIKKRSKKSESSSESTTGYESDDEEGDEFEVRCCQG